MLVFLLATAFVFARTVALADTPSSAPTSPGSLASGAASPVSSAGKFLNATLAREAAGEIDSSFSTETPRICLRWQGESFSAGEKIRCIWIAEDVGRAAPANYHVDEASYIAGGGRASGAFTLTKPKKDWPEGKYRAEIYVGTQLVETLPFTIEKARGD